ncbi:hypothetical protein QQZ08_004719 [Neonectria magnoliae]|uniref:Uncharacterized protein n=1 Tax=Neonectria magnoliae TaxID=2732573 RepID=A0ABR1I6Z4_9HYPO
MRDGGLGRHSTEIDVIEPRQEGLRLEDPEVVAHIAHARDPQAVAVQIDTSHIGECLHQESQGFLQQSPLNQRPEDHRLARAQSGLDHHQLSLAKSHPTTLVPLESHLSGILPGLRGMTLRLQPPDHHHEVQPL